MVSNKIGRQEKREQRKGKGKEEGREKRRGSNEEKQGKELGKNGRGRKEGVPMKAIKKSAVFLCTGWVLCHSE